MSTFASVVLLLLAALLSQFAQSYGSVIESGITQAANWLSIALAFLAGVSAMAGKLDKKVSAESRGA